MCLCMVKFSLQICFKLDLYTCFELDLYTCFKLDLYTCFKHKFDSLNMLSVVSIKYWKAVKFVFDAFWFGLWYLTPLSTIFQLYCGGQFYQWRKLEKKPQTIKIHFNIICMWQIALYTVKPVLRGHFWDKEKVVF